MNLNYLHPRLKCPRKARRRFIPIFIWLISICMVGCVTGMRDKTEEVTTPFSFGVIADVQYCDCDAYRKDGRGRVYRASLKKLADCVEDFNSQDLAFVIQLGDLIERDFVSFEEVLPIYERLKTPKYHVLGNHEFQVADQKKDAVPKKLGLKDRYYDFTVGGWRFVVLDVTDLSLYADAEDSKKHKQAKAMLQKLKESKAGNAQGSTGGFGSKQLNWLKTRLRKASNAGEKVILFCHAPLNPPNTYLSLWNAGEVIEILESYDCVVAYMNGHAHTGGYSTKNGIHYLTLQGMVETATQNAYATIEVFEDHLNVVGVGRVPSRTLVHTENSIPADGTKKLRPRL